MRPQDEDFDQLLARRRHQAGLPELSDPNLEQDNEGDF